VKLVDADMMKLVEVDPIAVQDTIARQAYPEAERDKGVTVICAGCGCWVWQHVSRLCGVCLRPVRHRLTPDVRRALQAALALGLKHHAVASRALLLQRDDCEDL
jgi:hypothetical protein